MMGREAYPFSRRVSFVANDIEPVIARGRRDKVPAPASPSVEQPPSAPPLASLLALLSSEVAPGDLSSLLESKTVRAILAGLWALPAAVLLLLATYAAFIAYCRANPLEVAAFFGPRPSAELVAPVIVVLLVVAVGSVCGIWLITRRDARRVPIVAASACLTLSLVAVIPAVFLKPTPPPLLEQARIFASAPDHVNARVLVDVPVVGHYLLEPSLNGVSGPSKREKLVPGSRIMEFEFAAQDVRRALLEGGADPQVTLQLRMSQLIEGEGYRPLQVTEWPFTQEVVDPIMRELSSQASR